MKNKPDVFYIIFVKHPLQTLGIIEDAFHKFDAEMPVLEIRFVAIKNIKNSSESKLILARIMKIENSSFDLINVLQKIPGIVITNQIEIL